MTTDGESVEDLLRKRIGLDPASIGPGLVARATRARMNALGIAGDDAGHGQYRAVVNRSESELQALVEEVVIPESWFFRDEHPFALLAGRAAAGWLTDLNRPPLRALSLPCAGGEEAYSIAITLIDAGLPARRFRVDAVDVSRSVLIAARRGVYSRNAFRSSDLTFRDRYFRVSPEGFELSDEVKATVGFQVGNLLDPVLLADRPPYDVVFCRNLLIYFDDHARRLAMANIDRLLGPSGLLFLGHAENLGPLRKRFRAESDVRCFAFERTGPAPEKRSTLTLPKASVPGARHVPVMPPKRKPAPHAPRQPINPAPPPTPRVERAESLTAEAARLADEGRHAEAAELCEREIGRGGLSPAPYYLMGVIRQATGDHLAAERSFEKAVYLDPGHEDALLALSLLSERRGDAAAAAGYRRRAERAYGEKHPR